MSNDLHMDKINKKKDHHIKKNKKASQRGNITR